MDYTDARHRIEFGVEDRSHTFDIPINNDDVVEISAEMFRVDLYVHEQPQPVPYICTFVQIEDNDGMFYFKKSLEMFRFVPTYDKPCNGYK